MTQQTFQPARSVSSFEMAAHEGSKRQRPNVPGTQSTCNSADVVVHRHYPEGSFQPAPPQLPAEIISNIFKIIANEQLGLQPLPSVEPDTESSDTESNDSDDSNDSNDSNDSSDSDSLTVRTRSGRRSDVFCTATCQEFSSLRLVCRSWKAVADSFLFRSFSFCFSPERHYYGLQQAYYQIAPSPDPQISRPFRYQTEWELMNTLITGDYASLIRDLEVVIRLETPNHPTTTQCHSKHMSWIM
jgi:F-box-like